MKSSFFKPTALALVLLATLQLAGCASAPQRNPEDPLEPFNRSMFAFNEGLDKAIAKPVAQGYQNLTPYPVRLHVGNFFNNLQDGWTVVNNALQLRPMAFAESFFRFGFNTFLGMGGFVNVADSMGLAREQQDFGKTLGRWGVPSGPYVVLPVLGASTVRDSAGLVVDLDADLLHQEIDHIPSRNSLYALRLVDKRANLLAAGNILEEAALDKYAFMRTAYLQKRRSDIDALRHQKTADDDYYNSLPYDAPPDAPDDAAPAAIGSHTWLHEALPSSVPTAATLARSNAALQAPVAHLLNR
jgi:phospholipid-binding lipoprotein MlaA